MNRSLVRPAACALAAAAFTLILLSVPASSPSAQTITLSGFGCSGTVVWNSASNTLSCQTSGGTFGCSISASPSAAPLLTQAVTLTANCSNAAGSVSYTWTAGANAAGCPSIASSTSQANLVVPNTTSAVNCTYNLSANDTATTVNPSKTLSYSAGGSGGGGGGGGGNVDISACTALGLNAKVIVAAWASNTTLYTGNNGTFGPNDAVIVQFTTGSIASPLSGTKGGGSVSIGHISSAEYQGPTTPRSGSLSTSPCDFTVGLPMGDGCGTTMFSGDTSPSKGFTVTTPPSAGACAATLQPNTTYYWNLTNFVPAPPIGTQQCSQSACNMIITLNKPSGT